MPWLSGNRSKKTDTSYALPGSSLFSSTMSTKPTNNSKSRQIRNNKKPRKDHDSDRFEDEESSPFTGSEEFATREEREKEQTFQLEEDLFSLIFLVFFLQIFILGLALTDLTRDVPVFSEYIAIPVDVPIDIETQVVIAQVVSLVVATLKEEDIFVSLKAMILVGHDESVLHRFPGANVYKWWLSNSLRLAEGMGTVMVSFYFIVQADNVLDIFENFAAMEFISYLDNMVFKLARWGYLGKELERMTIKVESVQHRVRRDGRGWWITMIVIFLSLTFLPMLSFWTQVRIGQHNGFYLEQMLSPTLAVWFNDDKFDIPADTQFMFKGTTRDMTSYNVSDPPELNYAFFSGNYEVAYEENGKFLHRHNQRPIYLERNATRCRDDPSCGMFYYCKEMSAWVFTIPALGDAVKELDRCEWGWLMMSEETEAFSLAEVSPNWRVWTGVIQDTHLSVIEDQCKFDSDCSLNGVCMRGHCICENGWSGQRCNVKKPFCYAMNWTFYGESAEDYKTEGPYHLSNDIAYGRPVYYRNYSVPKDVCSDEQRYDVYMYTGRRWSLALWCYEDLARYLEFGEFRLEDDIHAYWDNILGLDQKWYSEKTESHSGINLEMFEIRDSYSIGSNQPFGISFPTQGTFECLDARCNYNPHICGRHGSCEPYEVEKDGIIDFYYRCACKNNYGGLYCQFSPFGYYASDHFREFKTNPDLEPTSYLETYWKTGAASGEL